MQQQCYPTRLGDIIELGQQYTHLDVGMVNVHRKSVSVHLFLVWQIERLIKNRMLSRFLSTNQLVCTYRFCHNLLGFCTTCRISACRCDSDHFSPGICCKMKELRPSWKCRRYQILVWCKQNSTTAICDTQICNNNFSVFSIIIFYAWMVFNIAPQTHKKWIIIASDQLFSKPGSRSFRCFAVKEYFRVTISAINFLQHSWLLEISPVRSDS